MGAEVALIATIASTAFSFIGGLQEAAAAEAMGEQQQAIANMQAQQTRAVAERNALIMEDQAKYDAARMEEQGRAEQATAQRAAIEERRRKLLTQSRAQAVAGASGAGALDPTVLDIASDIEGEGEYNALAALYQGDSASNYLKSGAALRKYEGVEGAKMTRYGGASQSDLLKFQGATAKAEGDLAASQARMKAVGSLFKGGSDMYSKYAPKQNVFGGSGDPIMSRYNSYQSTYSGFY